VSTLVILVVGNHNSKYCCIHQFRSISDLTKSSYHRATKIELGLRGYHCGKEHKFLEDFDEAKRVAFADHIEQSITEDLTFLDNLIMTDECVMDLTGKYTLKQNNFI
jgi:hypothetical protein